MSRAEAPFKHQRQAQRGVSGSIYKKKEIFVLILLLTLTDSCQALFTRGHSKPRCCVSAYYASALRGRQSSFPGSSFLLVSTKKSKTRVGSGDEIGRWLEGK